MYRYSLTCETVEDFLHFFQSFPFLSLSLLADSVSIRNPSVRVSFITTIIHILYFFVRSLDTNLFCLSRSHSCSCTEVNTTALTRSSHKIISNHQQAKCSVTSGRKNIFIPQDNLSRQKKCKRGKKKEKNIMDGVAAGIGGSGSGASEVQWLMPEGRCCHLFPILNPP